MSWFRASVALILVACGRPDASLELSADRTGLSVISSLPMERVQAWDPEGRLALDQPLPVPSERAFVALPVEPGSWTVRAAGATATLEVEPWGPVQVEVEAPVGQGRRPVADGEHVGVLVLGQEMSRAALVVTAVEPSRVEVRGVGQPVVVDLEAPGDREVVSLPLGEAPLSLEIEVAGSRSTVVLEPRHVAMDLAREQLTVASVALPTDSLGERDLARPPDRVTLPSSWWRQLLRRSGLGYRPRDDQAPWAWQAITVENHAEVPVTLLVRSTVVDADGEPAAAFRPRLRESVGDSVQGLIRVPPGSATATLPLFVDGAAVDESVRYTRRIEILAFGGEEPLHVVEAPLWVSRGSPWASGWLVAALAASGLGWLALVLGAPGWIRRARTADLVTVAQFASVTWVAGTALQVAGLGVAAVLGPFAPLLTGLAHDTLRACLLGTLVALVPRPGTAALATAVGFVMRGLTMGTFHPVDLLYLGSAVFWLELWLWVSGCTRGQDWRDRPIEVWARLCVGLGVSNLCATATGLVVSVVFYRLYFAGWYVGLILAGPGFLYVCLGCALAVGFSRSLRRVEG